MKSWISSILLVITLSCCGREAEIKNPSILESMQAEKNETPGADTVVLGGGCFWCTEAQLKLLKGVLQVIPGYAGGKSSHPGYKEVCTGTTGHAEVIEVVFDPSVISYDEVLAAFWQAHDPTQLNRQGNDVGTQYRSVILYRNQEQKEKAEAYKKQLNDEKAYDHPVVTEIAPLTAFYAAENYHLDYYNRNKEQGYCQYVIQPKIDKFKKVFQGKLK